MCESEEDKLDWSSAEDSEHSQLNEENIALVSNISHKKWARVTDLRKLLSNYYKTKPSKKSHDSRPTLRKMSSSELKQFDGEKWEVFVEQFDSFVLVNDIEDKKKYPFCSPN